MPAKRSWYGGCYILIMLAVIITGVVSATLGKGKGPVLVVAVIALPAALIMIIVGLCKIMYDNHQYWAAWKAMVVGTRQGVEERARNGTSYVYILGNSRAYRDSHTQNGATSNTTTTSSGLPTHISSTQNQDSHTPTRRGATRQISRQFSVPYDETIPGEAPAGSRQYLENQRIDDYIQRFDEMLHRLTGHFHYTLKQVVEELLDDVPSWEYHLQEILKSMFDPVYANQLAIRMDSKLYQRMYQRINFHLKQEVRTRRHLPPTVPTAPTVPPGDIDLPSYASQVRTRTHLPPTAPTRPPPDDINLPSYASAIASLNLPPSAPAPMPSSGEETNSLLPPPSYDQVMR